MQKDLISSSIILRFKLASRHHYQSYEHDCVRDDVKTEINQAMRCNAGDSQDSSESHCTFVSRIDQQVVLNPANDSHGKPNTQRKTDQSAARE
jgi:hypothetical protein